MIYVIRRPDRLYISMSNDLFFFFLIKNVFTFLKCHALIFAVLDYLHKFLYIF